MTDTKSTITLILLSGMDGTGELFAPFIQAMGTAYKVKQVAYPNDQAMRYNALLAYACAELPKDERYVVLGESFSGPVAVELAACASPQLAGIILCSTFVRNPRPWLSGLRFFINRVPV